MPKVLVKNARKLNFDNGIFREPTPDDTRIIVWVPGARDGKFQLWQRVATTSQPESIADGIFSANATAIQARQPIRGLFRKILHRFQSSDEDLSWTLPDGSRAQQFGERQNDLLLVWAEEPETVVDEAWIESRRPMRTGIERIGPGIFIVSGVAGPEANDEGEVMRLPGCPRAEAEQMLAQARAAGDIVRETWALTDLGVMAIAEKDARGAVARFEEALVLARKIGDPTKEADIQGNMGVAFLKLGQLDRSQSLFETHLRSSRAAGDPFGEKLALERLGVLYSRRKDRARANRYFEEALAIARATGDSHHQSTLLWALSVEHAYLGQREQAISLARLALDIKEKLGDPEAVVFRRHLDAYRSGNAGPLLGTTGYSVGIAGTAVMPAAAPLSLARTDEPGILRKAFTAAKAVAKQLGSGFKAVPRDVLQSRLQTCADCPQFTGLRCRACGCFTKLKSMMPHEKCPLGKWPK